MIEEVHIQNFRCLRDVRVPLKPLTVLIGPNDSGKSTFLRTLEYFGSEPRPKPDKTQCWQAHGNLPLRIWASGRDSDGEYWEGGMEIPPPGTSIQLFAPPQRGKWSRENRDILERRLMPTRLYALPAAGLPSMCEGLVEHTPSFPILDGNGWNLPAVLDLLLRRDRERLDAIIEQMRHDVPGLQDVHIGTPSPEKRQVYFKLDGGLKIPASEGSVGVQMLLFFLVLSYHPDPPKLVLIEEPENGLHPKRLRDVVEMLRGITTGNKCGHATQVILTTHSPYLLDAIRLPEDQVLVFKREEDGARTATPVDQEHLAGFLKDFGLGEIWWNESEDGLVGGGS